MCFSAFEGFQRRLCKASMSNAEKSDKTITDEKSECDTSVSNGFSAEETTIIYKILDELDEIPREQLEFERKRKPRRPHKQRKILKSELSCPLCNEIIEKSSLEPKYSFPWTQGLDKSSHYLDSSFLKTYFESEHISDDSKEEATTPKTDTPKRFSSCPFCEIRELIFSTPGGTTKLDQTHLLKLLNSGIEELQKLDITGHEVQHALEKLYTIGHMYKICDPDVLIPRDERDKFPMSTFEKFQHWTLNHWNERKDDLDTSQRVVIRDLRKQHHESVHFLEKMVEQCEIEYSESIAQKRVEAKKRKERVKTVEALHERFEKLKGSHKSLRLYTKEKMENLQRKDWLNERGLGKMALRLHQMPTDIQTAHEELLSFRQQATPWLTRKWVSLALKLLYKKIGLDVEMEKLKGIDLRLGRRYGFIGGDFEDLSRHFVLETLVKQCLKECNISLEGDFQLCVFQNVNLPFHMPGVTGELDFLIVKVFPESDVVEILAVVECKTQPCDITISLSKQTSLYQYLCGERPDANGEFFTELRLGVNTRNRMHISTESISGFHKNSESFLKDRLFYVTRCGNIFGLPGEIGQPVFKGTISRSYCDLGDKAYLKLAYEKGKKWIKEDAFNLERIDTVVELIRTKHVFVLDKYVVIEK